MEDGLIELGQEDDRTFGINLRLVRRQILKGKAGYIRRLKKLRYQPTIAAEEWASGMVSQLGLEPSLDNLLTIQAALDAQYQHDVSIRTKAASGNYNFKKNSTSWLDSSQLVYLAEPSFIFVTADEKLIQDVSRSVQRDRVLSFSDFLSMAASVP